MNLEIGGPCNGKHTFAVNKLSFPALCNLGSCLMHWDTSTGPLFFYEERIQSPNCSSFFSIGYNSSEYCPPVFLGIYGKESDLSCSGSYKKVNLPVKCFGGTSEKVVDLFCGSAEASLGKRKTLSAQGLKIVEKSGGNTGLVKPDFEQSSLCPVRPKPAEVNVAMKIVRRSILSFEDNFCLSSLNTDRDCSLPNQIKFSIKRGQCEF